MESKIIGIAEIKCTLGNLQMTKLLFGQYVFIAKSVNITNYSDYNTVQTIDCCTVFVQFHFHTALSTPIS